MQKQLDFNFFKLKTQNIARRKQKLMLSVLLPILVLYVGTIIYYSQEHAKTTQIDKQSAVEEVVQLTNNTLVNKKINEKDYLKSSLQDGRVVLEMNRKFLKKSYYFKDLVSGINSRGLKVVEIEARQDLLGDKDTKYYFTIEKN